VDKVEIVYSVNGLRASKSAGKTLYPSWIDRGQKAWPARKGAFCTSRPVDMQAFFHNRACLQPVLLSQAPVLQEQTCRQRTVLAARRQPGSLRSASVMFFL
jgi:hypothetical protein